MSVDQFEEFQKLCERAYESGMECVEFSTVYYPSKNRKSVEPRYGARVHRNGWDHSFYAKNVAEVLSRLAIYLDERGA